MKTMLIENIKHGMETAFIDASVNSNLAYRPQFVSNNYKEGRKVLSSIEDELLACDEFSISVAFVTMSGITPLLQTMKDLEKRGVRGRIMTTDYLMFSEPKALDKLAGLSNIDLRMYCSEEAGEGFHTKGYIFQSNEIYRIIVGSSNMTLSALTKNKEWNTRIVSTEQGEYTRQIINEYNDLWNSQYTVPYDRFIEQYRSQYEKNRLQREIIRRQKEVAREDAVPSLARYRLQPNKMQLEFIHNLKILQANGANKALLISATGDGGIIMTSRAKAA
jgi:HKD family nuclease